MTFAEKLKNLLTDRGIRQSELADRTGIHKAIISGYVNGRSVPRDEYLNKIATALLVSPYDLRSDIVGAEAPKNANVVNINNNGDNNNYANAGSTIGMVAEQSADASLFSTGARIAESISISPERDLHDMYTEYLMKTAEDYATSVIHNPLDDYTPNALKVARMYDQLNDRNKKAAIMAMLTTMIKKQNEAQNGTSAPPSVK